jgi:haloacid dehalogenase superfamily, subfamily IA, variant 1 with third motif having Dx(3-4)D or Dx(3-4)E
MDGIIFDLDGTLWDSTEKVAVAWNEVLQEQGITYLDVTVPLLKSLFGQTLPAIAAAMLPDVSESQRLQLLKLCCQREHEILAREGSPLYPHLEETLKYLVAKYPLFIVSNCQAGYIELFLELTRLGSYFKDHLCPGDTGNGKADNIREIVARNQLKSPVYVGDTSGDHQACLDANVPFVHATYGFGQTTNANFQINGLNDLTKLF